MPQTPPAVDDVVAELVARFGPLETSAFRGQTRVELRPVDTPDAFKLLKQLGFDLLVDVTCVDYLEYRGAKHRYGLVYLLAATATNQRLIVRAFLDDPDP